MWCVKAIYPHGSHFVFAKDGMMLRFKTLQEAKNAAEELIAENRRFAETKGCDPNPNISYLAVEEYY